ncbi:SGNH/GDSL hydrolase family protein [Rhodococcus sp. JG-3]|uniref:SGNH/GDSL hydrolase family protein n=1 Tax=Rhodococcus sp. JG-3 TaxID=1305835 RepID=UPI0013782B56|nr:SGNH/GDSL hydrolase family protein [Rhodococcus sp. JG-3]
MSFGLTIVAALVVVSFVAYAGVTSVNRHDPGRSAVPFIQPDINSGRSFSAVFVGDSYTEGVGSSSDSSRWSSEVARDMRWFEINLGVGGTGYLNSMESAGCMRASCAAYMDQAGVVAQFSPNVVVVAGGQNDMAAMLIDPSVVQASVHKTYGEIRRALPNVQIVAVGPSFPMPADDPEVERSRRLLDETVRSAAGEVAGTYVSLLDPPVIDQSMVLPDLTHVNDSGHRSISDRVVSVLSRR